MHRSIPPYLDPNNPDALFAGKDPHQQQFYEILVQTQAYRRNPVLIDLFEEYCITGSLAAKDYLIQELRHLVHEQTTNPDPFLDPLHAAVDEIPLGQIISKTGSIFGISKKDIPRHFLVLGSSGEGKSNFCYVLAGAVSTYAPEIKFLAIDFKGDFVPLVHDSFFQPALALDHTNLILNPLEPPAGYARPEMLPQWNAIITDVICDAFGLQLPSKSFLSEKLHQLYEKYGVYKGSTIYPTLVNLLELLEDNVPKRRSKEEQFHEGLVLRLKPLLRSCHTIFNYSHGFPIERLLDINLVLDLDGFLPEHQDILLNFVLHLIYYFKKSSDLRGEEARNVFICDEAARICSKKKEEGLSVSLLSTMIQRMREFQAGFVLCAQESVSLAHSFKANTNTKILFPVREISDLHGFGMSMGLNEQQLAKVHTLPRGSAVVKRPGLDPFCVQFPHIPVDKTNFMVHPNTLVLLEELKRCTKPGIPLVDILSEEIREPAQEKEQQKEPTPSSKESKEQRQEEKPTPPPEEPEQEKPREEKGLLTNDHLRFLSVIADTTEFIGVTAIYQQCNFTKNRGNKLKKELLALRYISESRIKMRPGRGGVTCCLFLTEKGWTEALRRKRPKDIIKGGSFHRSCVKKLAQYLRIQGYSPLIEYQLNGKHIDLVFQKDEKIYAIEFESSVASASHCVINCHKDLEAGAHMVFVIAPTQSVLKTIQRRVENTLWKSKRIAFLTFSQFIGGDWQKGE